MDTGISEDKSLYPQKLRYLIDLCRKSPAIRLDPAEAGKEGLR